MSENENIEPAQEHQVGCTCGCDPAAFQEYKKEMTVKIIISAVFFAAGYVISEFTSISSYVYLICFAISYIAVGFGVIRDALMLVGNKNIFNEYLLISVVSIGALAIKEYHEGCAVMLLLQSAIFCKALLFQKVRTKSTICLPSPMSAMTRLKMRRAISPTLKTRLTARAVQTVL